MKLLRVVVVVLLLAVAWFWANPEPWRDRGGSGTPEATSPRTEEADAPRAASGNDARIETQAGAREAPTHEPLDPRITAGSRPDLRPRTTPTHDAPRLPSFLPEEARDTLALIASDGPFPHRQDGAVFQNRERRLPAQARGYYREYTVRTPGERTRGARRIVTGGDPPTLYWYTDDHYASFRRFEVPR